MHSRENPINSSNQVIDSISPSAWSPNRSQEKGFPEAAPVSRNGQMSFLSEVREGQIFRGQEMRLNAKTNNTASVWVSRLSSYHAIIAPSNTSHTFFCAKETEKRSKGLNFKTLNIDRCLHACLPHPKKQEMMIDVFDQNPICNSPPCV